MIQELFDRGTNKNKLDHPTPMKMFTLKLDGTRKTKRNFTDYMMRSGINGQSLHTVCQEELTTVSRITSILNFVKP